MRDLSESAAAARRGRRRRRSGRGKSKIGTLSMILLVRPAMKRTRIVMSALESLKTGWQLYGVAAGSEIVACGQAGLRAKSMLEDQ
jgi:hypothetical protein